MPVKPLQPVVRYLHRAALASVAAATSDAELLGRFVEQHDEAAFELLVWRHGKMVLGLCRRVLRHQQDAEDAFQATFLALARKGSGIRKRTSIGGWLYRVAYRTALAARRGRRDQPLGDMTARVPDPAAEAAWRELRRALDEEINRLPERYRLPLVLCHFSGKSNAEAARELGCPCGTLESRLARARARLRTALARRGFALAVAGMATALTRATASAGPAHVLVSATARAATLFRVGDRGVPAEILALTRKVGKTMFLTKLKVVAALFLMAGGAALLGRPAADEKPAAVADELVAGESNALRLSAATRARLDIRTAEVKARTTPPRMLQLSGSLALDSDRLAAVRVRFAAEVVQINVRVGDRVKRGEILAVLQSTDLALKKGELIDGLLQLQFERNRAKRLEELHRQGAIPEATLTRARRSTASNQNAVTRAQRSLRVWGLAEEDIKALEEEADNIRARKGKRDAEKEKTRGRVEVRAPRDGTVLERNATVGEIVDTTVLFKIADLSRLLAVAQAAEADLPALQALAPAQRRWSVRPGVDRDAPSVQGAFAIGPTIDPATATASLRGLIDNAGAALRPGQFVRVTIPLPPLAREVVLPASALVEQGGQSFVFVQPDPAKSVYRLQRVQVVRRGQDVAHVRGSLKAGERVIAAGAVELKATLDNLTRRKAP